MYVVDPLLFFRGTTIFICNGCSLYKCWVVAKAVDYRTHMYLEYCERRLGWSTSYAFSHCDNVAVLQHVDRCAWCQEVHSKCQHGRESREIDSNNNMHKTYLNVSYLMKMFRVWCHLPTPSTNSSPKVSVPNSVIDLIGTPVFDGCMVRVWGRPQPLLLM